MFLFKLCIVSIYLTFGLCGVSEGSERSGYISLADHLQPQRTEDSLSVWTQSQLLERWNRDNQIIGELNKNPFGLRPSSELKIKSRLGSNQEVYADDDKGLFSAIKAAYNNHWVLKTRPEDWWTTISQKIATRIDDKAEEPAVRKFFVSHKGKKTLTVEIGSSISGIDSESFFQQMISKISEQINKPIYTTLMSSDFSESSSVDRVVNSIMLMYSFQEYFEYRANLACGIPGVIMEGSEEDWTKLAEKLEKVEEFLKPIDDVLNLGRWFNSTKAVLQKLLQTYKGNPDKEWWAKIMDIQQTFGSGGGTYLSGWFVTDFLGISGGELRDLRSGINVVPLKITADNGHEEEAALAAGFTGYTVVTEEVTDPATNMTFPSVQPITGWALLMDPNSPLF